MRKRLGMSCELWVMSYDFFYSTTKKGGLRGVFGVKTRVGKANAVRKLIGFR
jgi:hypothetical protein